jgi:hypothetical protein
VEALSLLHSRQFFHFVKPLVEQLLKVSLKTVVQSYFGWEGKGPSNNGPTQWNTMKKYAKRHGAYSVGFITLYNGGAQADALRKKLLQESINDKLLVFVASAQ